MTVSRILKKHHLISELSPLLEVWINKAHLKDKDFSHFDYSKGLKGMAFNPKARSEDVKCRVAKCPKGIISFPHRALFKYDVGDIGDGSASYGLKIVTTNSSFKY